MQLEKGNLRPRSSDTFSHFLAQKVCASRQQKVWVQLTCRKLWKWSLMGHLLQQKISDPNSGRRNFYRQHHTFFGCPKLCWKMSNFCFEKNTIFFKVFDQEAVLSVIYANPHSWGCKKVSGTDPTYSNWAQRPPSASVIDSRPVSGRKPAILLMPEWLRENSPDDLYADPKLGNRRTHSNLSQITVVCDYLTYKRVWDYFLKKCKNALFEHNFL